MPQRLTICLLWFGVLSLGLFLRLNDLEERPIHADEATGARIFSQKLEGKGYTFNAQHFHGPLLSVSTSPIAGLRGERNWSELSLYTLRIGPVIAGILVVLSPLLWARYIGMPAALLSAALLASSPLLVYYNRMYIHESWLCLFGMLALNCGYRLLLNPSTLKAVLTGLAIGLMFATKETFVISILSWFAAAIIYFLNRIFGWNPHSKRAPLSTYIRPAIVLGAVAFTVASIFLYGLLPPPAGNCGCAAYLFRLRNHRRA